MNRNELNRKLKQLHNDYVRDMKRIDERSHQRERRKFQELNEKFTSDMNNITPPDTSIDIEKNIDNETKTNNMNQENESNKLNEDEYNELKELYFRYKNLEKYFPQTKWIWIHQFPKWFIDLMKNR